MANKKIEEVLEYLNEKEQRSAYRILKEKFEVPVEKERPGNRRNKRAGNKYEQDVRNMLITIGYPHIISTRQGSRYYDGQGIDLMNAEEHRHGRFPYNIQCKNQTSRVEYEAVLGRIPKIPGIINVVFHKFTKRIKTGKAIFNPMGYFAILYKTDFIWMMKELLDLRKFKADAERPNPRDY